MYSVRIICDPARAAVVRGIYGPDDKLIASTVGINPRDLEAACRRLNDARLAA